MNFIWIVIFFIKQYLGKTFVMMGNSCVRPKVAERVIQNHGSVTASPTVTEMWMSRDVVSTVNLLMHCAGT